MKVWWRANPKAVVVLVMEMSGIKSMLDLTQDYAEPFPGSVARAGRASNGHTHGGLEEHGAEKESKSGAAHSHDKKPHSHKHGDKH